MRRAVLLAIPVLVVVLAACSSDGADRTIQVRLLDDMAYDPDRFDIMAGQTVRFEVTNSGEIRHEFFIGTLTEHSDHATAMREGGYAEDIAHPASVRLGAGESQVLEYTFTDAGELLVACHEAGHYEAGMVAPVTVHP